MRLWVCPLTVLKYPPTKTERPSGAGCTDSTLPSSCGTNVVLMAPVVTSKEKMWLRVNVGPPLTCSTCVKEPATTIVLPICAMPFTPSWRPPSMMCGVIPLTGLLLTNPGRNTEGSAAAGCTSAATRAMASRARSGVRTRLIGGSPLDERSSPTIPVPWGRDYGPSAVLLGQGSGADRGRWRVQQARPDAKESAG